MNCRLKSNHFGCSFGGQQALWHRSGMGVVHIEGTSKGMPLLETRSQRARSLIFQEKLMWHMHDMHAI